MIVLLMGGGASVSFRLEQAYICNHNEHWLCLRKLGLQVCANLCLHPQHCWPLMSCTLFVQTI